MADNAELFGETNPDDIITDQDVEMGGEVLVEIEQPSATAENGNAADNENEDPIEDTVARVTYIDYLKSPVIGLLVGQGDEQALLTAHQALLVKSPWFADACAKFSDEISV